MMVLKPKLIILDEIDSGVDVDNLKVIANAINKYKEENNASILIITHYPNILKYIKYIFSFKMNKGQQTKGGKKEDIISTLKEKEVIKTTNVHKLSKIHRTKKKRISISNTKFPMMKKSKPLKNH